jgi:hypothetical protein
MIEKLKAHFLNEASKDEGRGLTRPTVFNVLASLLCVVVLVAWAWWCWHLGLDSWESGRGHYQAAEVTAQTSPIRYWMITFGLFGLGAFSLDAAAQYGVEAYCRIRRILRNKALTD